MRWNNLLPLLAAIVVGQPLCPGADSTTAPATPRLATTPSDCMNSLGEAIAADDLARVQQLYHPDGGNWPTAQGLLDLERAAVKLNEVAKAHWGQDVRLVIPPSAGIPAAFSKSRIKTHGEFASSWDPASGLGRPYWTFRKVDGIWAVIELERHSRQQDQLMCEGFKRLATEIVDDTFHSANEARSAAENEIALAILGRKRG